MSIETDNLIPMVDDGLGNSTYLLDLGDGRALAVDPPRDLRAVHAAVTRRGLSPELREAHRVLPVGQGVIGWVASTGETVHMANLAASPELLPSARAMAPQPS